MVFVSRDAAVGRELTGQRGRERVFPAHGLASRPGDNLFAVMGLRHLDGKGWSRHGLAPPIVTSPKVSPQDNDILSLDAPPALPPANDLSYRPRQGSGPARMSAIVIAN